MVKVGMTNPQGARSQECVALKAKRACRRVPKSRVLAACRTSALYRRQDAEVVLVVSSRLVTLMRSLGVVPAGSSSC